MKHSKELLLAPNQWKLIQGIRVENTTRQIRRVTISWEDDTVVNRHLKPIFDQYPRIYNKLLDIKFSTTQAIDILWEAKRKTRHGKNVIRTLYVLRHVAR